jgi:adenylate cyclase
VASSVAGVIEPALQAAETARSVSRPTNDLTAYDLYLRAYAMALSSASQIPEALGLIEQAIARDPRYGPALGWAAFCCYRLLVDGRSGDPQADRLKGADFARRALEVAGDDPGVLANAAQALAYLGEDIGAMMALAGRALALNPSFARGWHIGGNISLMAGQPDTAIEHVETSMWLSPRARVVTSLVVVGAAHFSLGASSKQCRSCSSRSRRTPASHTHTAFSPPVTRTWVASTTHRRLSRDSGRLPLSYTLT